MTMLVAGSDREALAQIMLTAAENGWTSQETSHGMSSEQQKFHADGRLVRFVRDDTHVDVYWNMGGFLCVGRTPENVLQALATGEFRF